MGKTVNQFQALLLNHSRYHRNHNFPKKR